MKVAIIGTGIAGNVVAHHLHRDHDITLFEANNHIGGHTHTHAVTSNGRSYAVDTGFIVYNDRTYPNFIALLDQLGVPSQPTRMSFAVKCEASGLEYCGSSLNSLFAQRRNLVRPGFYRMLRDILRFNREAPLLLQTGAVSLTLGDYLATQAYSRQFVDNYIVPMGAAIWSTDPRQMLAFPASAFVRFFHNHGLLSLSNRPQWRVIKGGSKQYVDKLVGPFRERIRLGTPVTAVRRFASHVMVQTAHREAERFDAVFLACHSDQALAMLDPPTRCEREVLGAIPYQQNEAVLHTDTRLLPRRRLAWAAWNYHRPGTPRERVAVTYNMNLLQGLDADDTFCVTLNNTAAVRADRIIERVRYDHPVYNTASMAARARHKEINGVGRTYFCGAYWRNGFHEDGVVSALEAVKLFRERNGHAQQSLRRAG
jgi:predicted NAD/FAD-binding protein